MASKALPTLLEHRLIEQLQEVQRELPSGLPPPWRRGLTATLEDALGLAEQVQGENARMQEALATADERYADLVELVESLLGDDHLELPAKTRGGVVFTIEQRLEAAINKVEQLREDVKRLLEALYKPVPKGADPFAALTPVVEEYQARHEEVCNSGGSPEDQLRKELAEERDHAKQLGVMLNEARFKATKAESALAEVRHQHASGLPPAALTKAEVKRARDAEIDLKMLLQIARGCAASSNGYVDDVSAPGVRRQSMPSAVRRLRHAGLVEVLPAGVRPTALGLDRVAPAAKKED